MTHHRTIATVLAALAVLGLTACGDDATTADDPDTTVDADAPAPPTTHPGSHPGTIDDGVLTVEMGDFSFGGLPESVPVGTKLAVVNNSSAELHELVALRIADAETRSVAELMTLPEGELRAVAGPMPATVLLAAPGGPPIAAVGDGTLAEPGRYLLLCAIPTGVDPDDYFEAAAESPGGPPDVAGGPPHFVHGMFAELIVE